MNLWPARLHHLRRDSPQPERLAKFYGALLEDRVERLGENAWLVAGRHRRLVIGRGTAGAVPYFALQMQDAAQRRFEPAPDGLVHGDRSLAFARNVVGPCVGSPTLPKHSRLSQGP